MRWSEDQKNMNEIKHGQEPGTAVITEGAQGIGRVTAERLELLQTFIAGQNFTVDGGITRKMIYV